MARKKNRRLKRKSKRPHGRRKTDSLHLQSRLTRPILANLSRSKKPLSIRDLLNLLNLPHSAAMSVEKVVDELCRRGDLQKSGRSRFTVSRNLSLIEATIDKKSRGFGFATEVLCHDKKKTFTKDPFIPASKMASARHGDRALVRVLNVRRDGRPEAEVLHIIKRGKSQLAGFFKSDLNHGIVYPEDPRFAFSITVTQPVTNVQDGDAVIIKLIEQQEFTGSVTGEIIKILGSPASVAVQAELVVEKFGLAKGFNSETKKESLLASPSPGPDKREDLRELLHITIDGADAKDFDDAVCVEKIVGGVRLFVSIADVSAYVKPGSRLDLEAFERGTSVYFPGTVIPMLPENLSNNLCSLLPNEDRLTLTVMLDYDQSGQLTNKRLFRSIIKSKHRFTYDIVKKILIDQDQAIRKAHKDFLTPLQWASELAKKLQKKRIKRGAIRFSIPAAAISLNLDNTVNSITRTQTHFAHQIIEEFMLAANEAVANTFVESGRKTLFRIHERPDQDKVSEFAKFAATLGFTLLQTGENSLWYNDVIDNAAGTTHEYIINNLLLRTMQQARYSSDNSGHFGLATDNYLHFTSPIRRYPDLVVHRQICTLLDGLPTSGQTPNAPIPLNEAGQALSSKERTAISAERDMVDRLKRQFMSTQIGKTFAAVISGVTETSLYVELLETFISGIIKLSSMSDDYYLFDEKRYRVVGDISGSTFQIGDPLHVELIDVDNQSNKIFFKRVEVRTEQKSS